MSFCYLVTSFYGKFLNQGAILYRWKWRLSWRYDFFKYLLGLDFMIPKIKWIYFSSVSLHECCDQYWTGPGDNTPQSSSYTATYHPSRNLSKLDEPDIQYTAGEVGTSSLVMYSYGALHMAEQKGDQLEPTYSTSVGIRGVALMTCRKRWTIGRGGKKESEISVLMSRQDDDKKIQFHKNCKSRTES